MRALLILTTASCLAAAGCPGSEAPAEDFTVRLDVWEPVDAPLPDRPQFEGPPPDAAWPDQGPPPVASWAVAFGGTADEDLGARLAVDGAGNAYVTGHFTGQASFGSVTLTSKGEEDVFVAKLDPKGKVLWATAAGGSGKWDRGRGIAVDGKGNVYVTGYYYGTATFGPATLIAAGSADIFVSKLDGQGKWLWTKSLGGSGYDDGRAAAVDGSGNLHLAGHFEGSASFGVTKLNSAGKQDVVVAKLDGNGKVLWATAAGGAEDDSAADLDLDSSGNVYAAGFFTNSANFGSGSLSSAGVIDVFVAQLDSAGKLVWARAAGGTSYDVGYGVAAVPAGGATVTGDYSGTATFGTAKLTAQGTRDAFVARLDAKGSWSWAASMGGAGTDQGLGVGADAKGNAFVSGHYSGTASFGSSISLTATGAQEVFVAKLDSAGKFLWAKASAGSTVGMGNDVVADSVGNAYAAGQFGGTASFGAASLTAKGKHDAFVWKLAATTP